MGKLLTISEAATRLGLTEKGVRMKIFRRQLLFSKIGKRVLVNEQELEKFILLTSQVNAEEAAGWAQEAA